jgi:hypothetical protein
VAIRTQCIGQDEGVAPVILGAAHRVTVPESVDLLGIDGENGDTAFEKGIDHRTMRLFDRDRDALGMIAGETQQPVERHRKSLGAMLEASFLQKLSVSIEHAGLVKPLPKVDTDEQLVRESLAGRVLAAGL